MGLSTKQVDENSLDWRLHLERALEVANIGAEQIEINGNPVLHHHHHQQQQQQQQQPPLKCPRCDSINTKFCYYNNYSRLQPRHFCKACRRHWTAGGTLRNVPVGGGRKNKRSIKTPPPPPPTSTTTTMQQIVMQPFDGFFHLPEAAPPLELEIASLAPPPAEYFGSKTGDDLNNSTTCLHSFSSSSSSSTSFEDQEWSAFKMDIIPAMASSWQDDDQQEMHQIFPSGSHLSCWDDILDLVDLSSEPPALSSA